MPEIREQVNGEVIRLERRASEDVDDSQQSVASIAGSANRGARGRGVGTTRGGVGVYCLQMHPSSWLHRPTVNVRAETNVPESASPGNPPLSIRQLAVGLISAICIVLVISRVALELPIAAAMFASVSTSAGLLIWLVKKRAENDLAAVGWRALAAPWYVAASLIALAALGSMLPLVTIRCSASGEVFRKGSESAMQCQEGSVQVIHLFGLPWKRPLLALHDANGKEVQRLATPFLANEVDYPGGLRVSFHLVVSPDQKMRATVTAELESASSVTFGCSKYLYCVRLKFDGSGEVLVPLPRNGLILGARITTAETLESLRKQTGRDPSEPSEPAWIEAKDKRAGFAALELLSAGRELSVDVLMLDTSKNNYVECKTLKRQLRDEGDRVWLLDASTCT